MASPTTRETLKQYCLRALGKPVIDVNVDDDQLEDRLDEGLQYFAEYHFDGVEKVYLKHAITSTDITNEYITMADPVLTVLRIFPISGGTSASNLFNLRYQLHLNQFFDFSSTNLLNFTNVSKHIRNIEFFLTGEKPLDFNRKQNKLFIPSMNWGQDVAQGSFVIIEAWRALDPEVVTEVYDDMFLKEYMTALFKRQWGQNLSKFEGIQLPGGATLQGGTILEQANTEITRLREEMRTNFELPIDFLIG